MKSEQALIVNYFENQELESFIGDSDIPWFHGTHVCNILEYQNPRDVIPKNTEAEDRRKIDIGLLQPAWFVNEFGLYDLILNCRKPVAKPFKRWISHDVLPTIRKQGGYISKSATPEQLEALQTRITILQDENTLLKQHIDDEPKRLKKAKQDGIKQVTDETIKKVAASAECFIDDSRGNPISQSRYLKEENHELKMILVEKQKELERQTNIINSLSNESDVYKLRRKLQESYLEVEKVKKVKKLVEAASNSQLKQKLLKILDK